MNFWSLLGFSLAAIVFFAGMAMSTDNMSMFLDAHARLIVIGGSVAAASIAFQLDRMFLLFRVFLLRVLKGRRVDYVRIIAELMRMAEAYRTGSPQFDKMVKESKEHFLKEALEMATDGVLDHSRLSKVMRARVATLYHRHTEDALKFKTVGKYPPAFGLMGTTLGMIALLQTLGKPGAQKLIGPAMSIALVATLYGIVLANLVFNPISENLMDSAKETRLKNTIIAEGVLLILEKTNPLVLAEELNSYLLPSERIDWRKIRQQGAAASAKEAA